MRNEASEKGLQEELDRFLEIDSTTLENLPSWIQELRRIVEEVDGESNE